MLVAIYDRWVSDGSSCAMSRVDKEGPWECIWGKCMEPGLVNDEYGCGTSKVERWDIEHILAKGMAYCRYITR